MVTLILYKVAFSAAFGHFYRVSFSKPYKVGLILRETQITLNAGLLTFFSASLSAAECAQERTNNNAKILNIILLPIDRQ